MGVKVRFFDDAAGAPSEAVRARYRTARSAEDGDGTYVWVVATARRSARARASRASPRACRSRSWTAWRRASRVVVESRRMRLTDGDAVRDPRGA